jgi:raffinose/stachyose/melibiose transport system substrate-binding protein
MRNAHGAPRPRLAALAAVLVGLLAVVGCGSPGSGQSDDAKQAETGTVATKGLDKLGPVTLKVWADAGEEATMKRLIPAFEKQYPNVKVDLTLHGFDDHIKLIVNAMAGGDPPDVAQGGHGFLTDGALVKGKLVLPLDRYAEAYGWDERFPADTLNYTRWSDDATTFGTGKLYGIAPITELVGVYYNKAKLRKLGVQPPDSEAELEQVLEKAKAAGEQPIMLGNAEKYPATHAFSLLHVQEVPAAEIRGWIAGDPEAKFDSDGTLEAAEKMVAWAKAGYFGGDFDGVSNDDAVAKFADGKGVFMFAGSWNAPKIADGLGDDFGFFNFPPGDEGKPGAAGAPGLPWHISSSSEHPDVAAAFLAKLHSAEFVPDLVAVGRPPAQPGAKATGFLAEVVKTAEEQLGAGGQIGAYDHSTPTMLETIGSKLQEMLAGRTDANGFAEAVQADWTKFHTK